MKCRLSLQTVLLMMIMILSPFLSGWDWTEAPGQFTSIAAVPNDGEWTGTTSRGRPVSFTVQALGTQWAMFSVTTVFESGPCSGTTVAVSVWGADYITNDQFSYTSSDFSFTGQFTSSTIAVGTYSIDNLHISECGYLTESGAWTASVPMPPPAAFGKSAPANGAGGQSLNPIISWVSSTNTIRYEYCYDSTNNNSCDTAWTSAGTNTDVVLNGLVGLTTYYWQVRAVGNPDTTFADSGAWWSFTTALFGDVLDGYWAKSWIERLYNAGITSGCSTNPLMYCPEDPVTRAQMAVFLERGIHGSSYSPLVVALTFNDTAGNFAQYWIEALKSDGITGGCGTGIYCPEASTTRAEMAVFLLRSKHGASYTPPAATGDFSDVPPSYWAASWIEQLAAEGITSGCGTGIYCPDSPVTRAQMAVFLVRTFNLP